VLADLEQGSAVIYLSEGCYKLGFVMAVGPNPDDEKQDLLEVHLLCRPGDDGNSTHEVDEFLGGAYALRWDKNGSGDLQCIRTGVKANTPTPRGHAPCLEWVTQEELLEVSFQLNSCRIPDGIASSLRAKTQAKRSSSEVLPVISDNAVANDAPPSALVSGQSDTPMTLENSFFRWETMTIEEAGSRMTCPLDSTFMCYCALKSFVNLNSSLDAVEELCKSIDNRKSFDDPITRQHDAKSVLLKIPGIERAYDGNSVGDVYMVDRFIAGGTIARHTTMVVSMQCGDCIVGATGKPAITTSFTINSDRFDSAHERWEHCVYKVLSTEADAKCGCGKIFTRRKSDIKMGPIVTFEIGTKHSGDIPLELVLGDGAYELAAVIYGDDSHFISNFFHMCSLSECLCVYAIMICVCVCVSVLCVCVCDTRVTLCC
jgi:hypothetical protein